MDTNHHKTPPKKNKKMMSSTSERSSEEMFWCSICLEGFSEPVTTPCGHTFCKRCIYKTWATDGPCTCPLCNRRYDRIPKISVNSLFLEIVSQVKLESNSQLFKTGEVLCDAWSEPKMKALKSCQVCLSLFCQTHLQLHLTVSGLKRHQLMEPVENLEDKMCPKHQHPQLFCGTDEETVCMMCSVLEHKNHEFMSLEEPYECRRSSLLHMEEQKRLKVQEIQRCMELSDTGVHRERAAGLQAFTALMQCVQKRQDRFLEELQEKQSRNHKRAQELVQQLKQEICQLENISTEAEQLSYSQDPFHFLQRPTGLTPPAGLKEWSSVSFERIAARALSELEKHLSEDFNKLSSRLELQKVQQFVVDVTLDPDTAAPWLIVSEDLKHVRYVNVKRKKKLLDFLWFERYTCVMGKQCFSSGRFYFEVQVKGKTEWELGVAQMSNNRMGIITASPYKGFWSIRLRNKDKYWACAGSLVRLSVRQAPQKVGVFVDYGKGLVSFFDPDSAYLLFSFSGCSFREKLFPYFIPGLNYGGSNSAPLVLTAVETFSGESD